MRYGFDGSRLEGTSVYLVLFVVAFIVSIISTSKKNTEIDYWENKSKLVSIILAALLGRLGMHRFYLNRTGSGIIQFFGFLGIFAYPSIPKPLDDVLMIYSIITAIWSKLDIFMILFDGLFPFVESPKINCKSDTQTMIDADPPENRHFSTFKRMNMSENSINCDLENKPNIKEVKDNHIIVDNPNNNKTNELDDEKISSKDLNLIKELAILHKEGVLTDKEFFEKKTEILSRL